MSKMLHWLDINWHDSLSQISAAIAVVTTGMLASLFAALRIERQLAEGFSTTLGLWLAFIALLLVLDTILAIKLNHVFDASSDRKI